MVADMPPPAEMERTGAALEIGEDIAPASRDPCYKGWCIARNSLPEGGVP